MTLEEELMAEEQEACYEFSQSQWVAALLLGWRKDFRMAGVLFEASGLPGNLPKIDWERLMNRAATMKPALSIHTSLKNTARTWIANHCRHANDALWDGDYDKALALMSKGGLRKDHRVSARIESKKETKKATGGLLIIDVRNRDRGTDWKTCK